MSLLVYNPNQNAFRRQNIASWAVSNNIDTTIEIHRNAGGGVGYESWLWSGVQPSNIDRAIHNYFISVGHRDRGFKFTSGLQNLALLRSANRRGILIEIGFIDTQADNSLYDSRLTQMFNGMINAIRNVAPNARIGIVFGHGEGDPGAVAFGRQEAIDVRNLQIKASGGDTPMRTRQNFDGQFTLLKLNIPRQARFNVQDAQHSLNFNSEAGTILVARYSAVDDTNGFAWNMCDILDPKSGRVIGTRWYNLKRSDGSGATYTILDNNYIYPACSSDEKLKAEIERLKGVINKSAELLLSAN